MTWRGDSQNTHKEAACWTQWVQQTCAIFPVIIEATEGVSKYMRNIALWQQARVTLIRIFHLHSHHDSAQMQATRKLLHRLGISPKTYTFASIVYMRFTLQAVLQIQVFWLQPTQPAAQGGLPQSQTQAGLGAQDSARRAGNQMVGQRPQASRAEGIESGRPETPAATKAQQANLCAAVDAPRFHHQFEELPQRQFTKHGDHIAPFFIPSTRPVFTKHRTIKDIIHNWRDAHRRWHPEQAETCTCQPFREKLRQPARWTHSHRAMQSGTRRTVPAIL